MNDISCEKCKTLGLCFRSKHISPSQYIEGNPNALIWIVGLNPKGPLGFVETRNINEFADFDPNRSSYFRDFNKVSKILFDNWKSKNSKIAHTDIVKCFSNTFPPVVNINGIEKKVKVEKLVENCSNYLFQQIKKGKPKILICNGSTVCQEMLKLFPPIEDNLDLDSLTSYKTAKKIEGELYSFWIILTGFIGRIDDRNKRRLGIEFERILDIENIVL